MAVSYTFITSTHRSSTSRARWMKMAISLLVVFVGFAHLVSSQLPAAAWNYNPYHYAYSVIHPQDMGGSRLDTSQRLEQTTIALQTMQKELNVLAETSQHLAKTMVTVWILTTAKLDEAARRSAEISQQLAVTNDVTLNLKNALNDTRKDLDAMKVKVEDLTTELKATSSSASIGKMPNSCSDLQLIGHKISGLYSVMGNSSVENVYCDFTKESKDEDFQKFIGYSDVKSAPTYFYVQKNASFSTVNVPIPFEIAKVNTGEAIDLATGIFTTPRSGLYYFSFVGLAELPSSPDFVYLEVRLHVNGDRMGTGYASKASESDSKLSQIALQMTLNLRKEDKVWLQITGLSAGVSLRDANGEHHTHFSGLLLQEDFS
ncbi:hypothetical protein GHT06_011132 [Daphnia sinensis]|uniref:C1q domain-containing protein n=1 Tax=Daphnia sinensis TaxID=1820382 RepID=A0AAD5PZR3_9CRUS|nr:hypothetical protein GHT06_011132 [Daphnia sinensis]